MAQGQKFKLRTPGASGSAVSPPACAQQRVPAATDPIADVMDRAAIGMPRLLTPQEVADLLGLTERTLERWRIIGEGPRYVKLSRSTVRYAAQDVAEFVSAHIRANTSQ